MHTLGFNTIRILFGVQTMIQQDNLINSDKFPEILSFDDRLCSKLCIENKCSNRFKPEYTMTTKY